MAEPLIYPNSLPCPRVSDVTSKERRLTTAKGGEDGPLRTRVLQRDLLQREQAAFIFTFAQAEVFRAWWRDTLIYGGCWFGAHWPLPQGVPDGGYRFRRFIGAPVWQSLIPGVGWAMQATFEVRGLGTPEVIDGGAGPLFLDEFNGPNNVSISARKPDKQLNGSVWTASGPVNPTDVKTMGNGYATAPAPGGAEAYTYFNKFDTQPGVILQWGWRAEVTFMLPAPSESPPWEILSVVGPIGLSIQVKVHHQLGFESILGGAYEFVPMADPFVPEFRVKVIMRQDGCTVTVNEESVAEFDSEFVFNQIERMQIFLSSEESIRSPRVARIALEGSKL